MEICRLRCQEHRIKLCRKHCFVRHKREAKPKHKAKRGNDYINDGIVKNDSGCIQNAFGYPPSPLALQARDHLYTAAAQVTCSVAESQIARNDDRQKPYRWEREALPNVLRYWKISSKLEQKDIAKGNRQSPNAIYTICQENGYVNHIEKQTHKYKCSKQGNQ